MSIARPAAPGPVPVAQRCDLCRSPDENAPSITTDPSEPTRFRHEKCNAGSRLNDRWVRQHYIEQGLIRPRAID